MLVVDDDCLAVGVNVHAVDGAREQNAGILYERGSPTPEPPLKEAGLKAGEHVPLEVQQRP